MKSILPLGVILILLVSCGPSRETIATQTSFAITSTASSWTKTPTATATNTATPTHTATPTLTPTPTSTPFAGLSLEKLIAYKVNWRGFSHTYTGDIEVRLPSGEKFNITSDQPGDKILGGWSPDGKWVVYGRFEDAHGAISNNASFETPIELWRMDPNGGNKIRLSIETGPNEITDLGKSESWNGENFLAACRTGGPRYEICIVDVANGTVQMTGSYGKNPTYSPDRLSYAWQLNYDPFFYPSSDQRQSDLYVVLNLGSAPIKLTLPNKKDIKGYSWLPDSKNFIVLLASNMANETNIGEIYLIQADGKKEPEKILSITTKRDFWSWGGLAPNGNYLAIHGGAYGNSISDENCVVNLITKGKICLREGWDYFRWTPDSQLVGRQDGVAYIFDLETGEPTKVEQLNWLYSLAGSLPQP